MSQLPPEPATLQVSVTLENLGVPGHGSVPQMPLPTLTLQLSVPTHAGAAAGQSSGMQLSAYDTETDAMLPSAQETLQLCSSVN
jgi:hypothetical protein